jgi:hypothetical protein
VIGLNCIIGRMVDVALPAWVQAGASELADVFRQESGGDIRLTVDSSAAGQLQQTSPGPSAAYYLHRATQRLTRNRPSARPVRNIAILFASSYSYHGASNVFGLMFDRGFTTADDPNEEPTRIPREGCAVFLDTIRRHRQGHADYERESLYTTIHELGHVFNLVHLQGVKNYMASSDLAAPHAVDYHRFTSGQSADLARCSTSRDIWPGGSPYREVGPWSHQNVPAVQKRAGKFGLALSLHMGRHEFWAFEPVELDITVEVAGGVNRSFTLEDQIDPGYDRFRIWIEDPGGERRLYRCPRLYCAAGGTRRISPTAPFRRDVSIFGEAGGYTFRRPGVHRIWADFTPGRGRSLVSNRLEVNVLPGLESQRFGTLREVLGSPARAKLLYHRQLAAPRGDVRLLEELCEAERDWAGIGGVEYGLGRAMVNIGARRKTGRAAWRARGIEWLRRARDRDELGEHQRGVAEALVTEAGAPP